MAINRLAAAHRGTLRALQVVIHQLSDLSHGKVPPYYKELGQLIRQLSLCSAKVEVERGSAVPETALDILQKLEVKSRKCVDEALLLHVMPSSLSSLPFLSVYSLIHFNPKKNILIKDSVWTIMFFYCIFLFFFM